MDSKGRPQISRELLERLTSSNQPMGASAYGTASSPQAPSSPVRRHKYRASMLGSQHQVRQMGAEIGGRQMTRREQTHEPIQEKTQTGQNRPSAGFKEPQGRGYNPYGKEL